MTRRIIKKRGVAGVGLLVFCLFMTIGSARAIPREYSYYDNYNKKRSDSLMGTFRAMWKQWYDVRQEIVYPLNNIHLILNEGRESFVDDLRAAAGYNDFPGGETSARFSVGIFDAWLAKKSFYRILRDDIVGFAAKIACWKGLDWVIREVGEVGGRQNYSRPTRIAICYVKLYLVSLGARIITPPITDTLYDTITNVRH